MITQFVYVNYRHENGKIMFDILPGGKEPALLVTFESGRKLLATIPRVDVLNFRDEEGKFPVEQYMWNEDLQRWDITDTQWYNNSTLRLSNEFEVDKNTGKWEEEMTPEELQAAQLIGEFSFWREYIGRTAVFQPLFLSLQKFANKSGL